MIELTDIEFMESRRVRRGELTDPEAGESDVSLEALLAIMVYYRRTAVNRRKLGLSSSSARCCAGSWDDRQSVGGRPAIQVSGKLAAHSMASLVHEQLAFSLLKQSRRAR